MTSILLLSADKSVEGVIKLSVPVDITLICIAESLKTNSAEQLKRQADLGLILIDIDQHSDYRSQLKALKIKKIPVIALISDLNQREALYQDGIYDYLPKPLILKEIKTRLADYLQKIDFHNKDTQRDHSKQMSSQIIQNERLITIGRVITSICHEITNRMQAAQGALSLALEEHNLSDDMHSYLSIGQQETRRVGQLVRRLQQIYRPKPDPISEIILGDLLSEIRALALDTDTIINHQLSIDLDISPDLPVIRGMTGQLQFVCLSLLLNLIAMIDVQNSSVIRIRALTIGSIVQIEYSTDAPLSTAMVLCMKAESDLASQSLESGLGISTFRQVLNPHKGEVGYLFNDPGVTIWINIPSM